MNEITLSTHDLKVRDKIISALAKVDYVATLTKPTGVLKYKTKDFEFRGTLNQFTAILTSIHQYEKKPSEWIFMIGNINVEFTLS